jgi:TfoX/Sxy family transcriptional regulator of competence genes
MSGPEQSPADLFASVATHCGVAAPAAASARFGENALKVNGKIFASLSRGRLLLKLPKARVDSLIGAGKAEPFSTGADRVKKEWVTIAPSTADEWCALAQEARAFVGGGT